MATISSFDLQILKGIVETIDEHAAINLDEVEAEDRKIWQEEKQLATQSIVNVWLPWFLGHDPNPSETTRASRSYKRLEEAGFVERIEYAHSSRVAQLFLTDEGRSAATDPAVAEAVATPRTKLDAFLADRCELSADAEVEKTGLYISYIQWCELKNLTPVALAEFDRQLLAVPTVGRVHRANGERAFGVSLYLGIRLRDLTAASL